MSLYAIADLHLSISVAKPMDIFHGWNDYMLRLKNNWNHLITDKDTVVIPGDISWGLDLSEAKDDLLFLDSLPGQKILIKGNHDYWWPTRNKADHFLAENNIVTLRMIYHDAVLVENTAVCGTRSWFYEEGDTDSKVYRRELLRLRMSLDEAKKTDPDEILVFLHYPPIYGDFIYHDYIELMKEYGVKRCFYGHLHGSSINNAFNGNYNGIDFKLISADSLGFCPLYISLLNH